MNVFIVDDPRHKGRKRRVAMALGPAGQRGFVDGLSLELLRLGEVVAFAPQEATDSDQAAPIAAQTAQSSEARDSHAWVGAETPPNTLVAPMAGRVLEILVQAGQPIAQGSTLLVLEAMKTEQALRAPFDAVVAKVLCEAWQQVTDGAWLIELTPADKQDT